MSSPSNLPSTSVPSTMSAVDKSGIFSALSLKDSSIVLDSLISSSSPSVPAPSFSLTRHVDQNLSRHGTDPRSISSLDKNNSFSLPRPNSGSDSNDVIYDNFQDRNPSSSYSSRSYVDEDISPYDALDEANPHNSISSYDSVIANTDNRLQTSLPLSDIILNSDTPSGSIEYDNLSHSLTPTFVDTIFDSVPQAVDSNADNSESFTFKNDLISVSINNSLPTPSNHSEDGSHSADGVINSLACSNSPVPSNPVERDTSTESSSISTTSQTGSCSSKCPDSSDVEKSSDSITAPPAVDTLPSMHAMKGFQNSLNNLAQSGESQYVEPPPVPPLVVPPLIYNRSMSGGSPPSPGAVLAKAAFNKAPYLVQRLLQHAHRIGGTKQERQGLSRREFERKILREHLALLLAAHNNEVDNVSDCLSVLNLGDENFLEGSADSSVSTEGQSKQSTFMKEVQSFVSSPTAIAAAAAVLNSSKTKDTANLKVTQPSSLASSNSESHYPNRSTPSLPSHVIPHPPSSHHSHSPSSINSSGSVTLGSSPHLGHSSHGHNGPYGHQVVSYSGLPSNQYSSAVGMHSSTPPLPPNQPHKFDYLNSSSAHPQYRNSHAHTTSSNPQLGLSSQGAQFSSRYPQFSQPHPSQYSTVNAGKNGSNGVPPSQTAFNVIQNTETSQLSHMVSVASHNYNLARNQSQACPCESCFAAFQHSQVVLQSAQAALQAAHSSPASSQSSHLRNAVGSSQVHLTTSPSLNSAPNVTSSVPNVHNTVNHSHLHVNAISHTQYMQHQPAVSPPVHQGHNISFMHSQPVVNPVHMHAPHHPNNGLNQSMQHQHVDMPLHYQHMLHPTMSHSHGNSITHAGVSVNYPHSQVRNFPQNHSTHHQLIHSTNPHMVSPMLVGGVSGSTSSSTSDGQHGYAGYVHSNFEPALTPNLVNVSNGFRYSGPTSSTSSHPDSYPGTHLGGVVHHQGTVHSGSGNLDLSGIPLPNEVAPTLQHAQNSAFAAGTLSNPSSNPNSGSLGLGFMSTLSSDVLWRDLTSSNDSHKEASLPYDISSLLL